ncbi:MAG: hypothetical protein E7369_00305 [Clostridiales bacterium]|nr:hypothetical protein [Clostridiales bacterium]
MKILDVILIGVALSIDAMALTIANCATYKNTLNKKNEWSMPIAFAIFQGVMPLLGYYLGSLFCGFLDNVSGYLTAGIFFLLAIKIIVDIIKDRYGKEKDKPTTPPKFSYALLIIQAVATSIDAFLIGFAFAMQLTFSIYFAILIIAAITFVLVTIALFCGKYLGKLLGDYAEIFGALILIAIAVKTLIEAII